ncbi:MAG: site-specific integrase [Candidatus Marinimicrobia bacterium]|nr:site-specific integrase [Candidatus Neomarinimicrobiota bacterium]
MNPADYTIKFATTGFIKSKATDKAYKTIIRYRNIFDHLYKHFGETYPLKFIDSGAIQSFTLFYLQDHTKPGTNLALRHLKAFLRWCYDMEYIARVPKISMLKVEENGIRWLTREEYEKIYNKAQPEIQDIMTLCISTGARINELLNCPWEKIKFDEKVIALNPKLVKGRRMEALYLNDRCIEILTRIREEQKPLKKSPLPYSYDYVAWRYAKACKAAGIKSSPHDLRRSAGAWLLQNGVPIYQVSRFLRHSSVTVTEKSYADLVKKNYSDLSNKIIEILS